MKEPQQYETIPLSLNNRLIVEAYKKEALRSKEKNGFAFVDQKLTLKGLRILVNAKLTDGTMISKGSIAYIKEEHLHTQPWAQKALECSFFEEPFLIVDVNHIEFIEPTQHVTDKFVQGLIIQSCTHGTVMDGVCTVCKRSVI